MDLVSNPYCDKLCHYGTQVLFEINIKHPAAGCFCTRIFTVAYCQPALLATQFRQWATKVLDTFTKQGYVLGKERLINGQIFVDYSLDSQITRDFFATVQNKMHYAVHGNTAAEVIVERADHNKEHMGLTTWRNAPSSMLQRFCRIREK